MKLSAYAKEMGITRQTASRWFHEGRIPGAYQLDTGTIIVPNDIFEKDKGNNGRTIIMHEFRALNKEKLIWKHKLNV